MQELKLKDIGLTFEGGEKHIHRIKNVEVPGCTSVSGLFQDDGWKFAWPVKLMYEVIENELKHIVLDDNDHINTKNVLDIAKKAKNAWKVKRDKSADTGTIAHGLIEDYIKTGMLAPLLIDDKEVKNCIEGFIKFELKYKPEWIASEVQVGSEIHMFGGILDALVKIEEKLILLDFKTSKDIKDDYAIQLAGLMIALNEQGIYPDGRAILHLPKEGEYEFRILDGNLEEEKKDFLAGLNFLKRKNMFMARCKSGK